jgi:mevalonate kinase
MKNLFAVLLLSLSVMLAGCGSSGDAEWAVGTWERASGIDHFTVTSEYSLEYQVANLNDVKPKKVQDSTVVWDTKAVLGQANLTLTKVSENEAKLITKIGEMREEKIYTKKNS